MSFTILKNRGSKSKPSNLKVETFKVHCIPSDRLDATQRGKKDYYLLQLIRLTLQRDKLCRICAFRVATIGDHIRRRVSRADDTMDNLWGLCKRCHDIKTTLCDGGFGNTLATLTTDVLHEIRKRSLKVEE
jgi:5-methylcytosine-specific restriction endonuclease McrA